MPGGGNLYHNYLVWGSSGEGKTYFATEVARAAQIPRGKVSLASAKDVPSEAALKAHLAGALQQAGPYLFIIDEADKRDEPWICSALFDSLSNRKNNPQGNTVFVLIGSTGHSLDGFWNGMEAHKGGRDLRTRIPPEQMIILPATTLGDRLLVVLGQIRRQAREISHPVSIIDKLALAYALLSPNGATPRGIEGLVVRAMGHLTSQQSELRYGHFFGPGDEENARFIHQYPNLYRTLQNDSLRLT
ncbi:MAG: AAA family ATPase [Limisphaerales bacterium]